MPPERKLYIRLLILLSFPALALQFYYSSHYQEPFPAIMMPSFTYGKFEKDKFELPIFYMDIFFANQDSIRVNEHDILRYMHKPQRNRGVRFVLGNEHAELQNDAEYMEWFAENLEDLTQRKDIEYVRMHYKKLFVHFQSDSTHKIEETIFERELVLNGK